MRNATLKLVFSVLAVSGVMVLGAGPATAGVGCPACVQRGEYASFLRVVAKSRLCRARLHQDGAVFLRLPVYLFSQVELLPGTY